MNTTSALRALFLLTLATVFGFCGLRAQEFSPTYKWSGELRLRGEVDARDFNCDTPPNSFGLSRARLGIEAIPVENVRVFLQAQDSRVFGTESDGTGFNTLADTRNIDLHQGFLEVDQLFVRELTMRLGRQELSYGNERLVGAVGWNNVGRSFDGALFRLGFEDVTLDAFIMTTGETQTYPSVATPASVAYVRDAGQRFCGLTSTLKSIENHRMDFYAFYQWNRLQTVANEDDVKRITAGTYQKGSFDAIEYEAELAYQGGKYRGTDVSAYLLTANLGYGFSSSLISKAVIGCDYLSGTPAGETNYKSFDPMYHTGHKFYGFMDYFINIPANTGNRGLMDLYARVTSKISDQVDANLWIHQMSLAQSQGGEKGLGQEFDGTLVYRYNKVVKFDLGLSAFIPAPVMRQNFGHSDVAYWGYLIATVSF